MSNISDVKSLSIDIIYKRYTRGKLYLPWYQRGEIWKEEKQSLLIDSILQGIPIQSLIFSKEPDDKEKIVDGGNRVISISKFINGEIPSYSESDDNKKFIWFKEPSNQVKNKYIKNSKTNNFHIFSDDQREDFLSKGMVVITYTMISQAFEILIFARQQYGEEPSKGELLRVTVKNSLVCYLNEIISQEIEEEYKQLVLMYKQANASETERARCFYNLYTAIKLMIYPAKKVRCIKEGMLNDNFSNIDFRLRCPVAKIQKMLQNYNRICSDPNNNILLKRKDKNVLVAEQLSIVIMYLCSIEEYVNHIDKVKEQVNNMECPSKCSIRDLLTTIQNGCLPLAPEASSFPRKFNS